MDYEFRFTNFKFFFKNEIRDPFQKSMKRISKSVS